MMQTLKELVAEIARDLPEISEFTIQAEFDYEGGVTTFYHQDGQVLFSGENREDLEIEYQMFCYAQFPDFYPFRLEGK